MKRFFRKAGRNLLMVAVLVIVSSICIYAGIFLFWERKSFQDGRSGPSASEPVPVLPETEEQGKKPVPVTYRHLSEVINGRKQEIHILEAVISDKRVEIVPALSYNQVFGFEKLSEIVSRAGAFAAVNGGFFSEYGEPIGMVIIDGKAIRKSTGSYPVFMIKNGRASLEEVQSVMELESDGAKLTVDRVNDAGKPGEAVLYTPDYGSSNRAGMDNITAVITGNVVSRVIGVAGETKIPKDGMLFTLYLPARFDLDSFPLEAGDTVKFLHDPEFPSGAHAYECGSWIVRDGSIVIGEWDAWTGVTTNRDPRTAIGLKNDTTVILLTVDGRQPGYSYGLTGKELGELLLKLGVRDAAMLDGGASTEMIVDGKIVNRPSFKGQERPLGGALVIRVREE